MPIRKITLSPGINVEMTPTLNESGYALSNLMRWRDGLAETLGGWEKFNDTAMIGSVRALWAWQDLDLNRYLAVGSNERLQIIAGGTVWDITPIRATVNLANPLSTTINTPTVGVADVAHGASVGDWIEIAVQTTIGGLQLLGFYQIDSVVSANAYTFDAGADATSTVAAGGTTPAFTTINLSPIVTVAIVGHGLVVGDAWPVQISTAVGGLTVAGDYIVSTVPTADSFTIVDNESATSGATVSENAGDVRINYLLASGLASTVVGTGWGGGTWGSGTWGFGSGGMFVNELRYWYLDNFGENLVAAPTNGTLYEWIPPVAVGNVATEVTNAPDEMTAMFVAMPQAQVIALGAETGSVQDPLLIRWCTSGDYTVWTAASDNTAGSYRLSRGSRIIGGIQCPQYGLVSTDVDLWIMQFTGYPLVYSINQVASGCGWIAPKAAATLLDTTYWGSPKGFYSFGPSGVRPVDCPVWDIVFKDLDSANQDKCIAAVNSLFNEWAFYFPSASGGTGEIDKYVKFQVQEDGQLFWDYGDLIRTAWLDDSILGPPIGCDGNNYLQQHEIGYTDDGALLASSWQSGYMDMVDGDQYLQIDECVPDFKWDGDDPQIRITFYGVDFPGQGVLQTFTQVVTPTTAQFNPAIRARQVSVLIECITLGTYIRQGAVRLRVASSGSI